MHAGTLFQADCAYRLESWAGRLPLAWGRAVAATGFQWVEEAPPKRWKILSYSDQLSSLTISTQGTYSWPLQYQSSLDAVFAVDCLQVVLPECTSTATYRTLPGGSTLHALQGVKIGLDRSISGLHLFLSCIRDHTCRLHFVRFVGGL